MRESNLQLLEPLLQRQTPDRHLHHKAEARLQDSLQQEVLAPTAKATIHAVLLQEIMVEADKQLVEV